MADTSGRRFTLARVQVDIEAPISWDDAEADYWLERFDEIDWCELVTAKLQSVGADLSAVKISDRTGSI